jgi:hypothetical protein
MRTVHGKFLDFSENSFSETLHNICTDYHNYEEKLIVRFELI